MPLKEMYVDVVKSFILIFLTIFDSDRRRSFVISTHWSQLLKADVYPPSHFISVHQESRQSQNLATKTGI